MKISLCMPIFGSSRAKVFCDAVYSALLQGYDDFELVVQDGDEKNPLVKDARIGTVTALLGDRFNYSCGRDRGIFDALNKALKRSTGEILYFFCSDDLLCPGALAAVNEVFTKERFGGPYWLYGKTISADATGKTLGVDGAAATYEQLLEHNRIGQPSVFWNRQMMELAGDFDSRYSCSADYELWLRFWERREPWFLDQTLGVFRHHDDQHSSVNSVKVDDESRRISQRHRTMRRVIEKARNTWAGVKAYGANGIPESRN